MAGVQQLQRMFAQGAIAIGLGGQLIIDIGRFVDFINVVHVWRGLERHNKKQTADAGMIQAVLIG